MGVLLCLISAVGFGAMAIFGKLAYAQTVTPDALVVVRFVLAAVMLTGLQFAIGRRGGKPNGQQEDGQQEDGQQEVGRHDERRPTPARRTVLIALGLGAFGYATQASLYFLALDRLDASLVTMLLYTYPAMVTLLASALGRDRLTAARITALTLASAGTVLVLFGGDLPHLDALGVLFAFGAALTYTGYILLGDSTVQQMPPLKLTTLVMTGAALSLTLRAVLTGGVDLRFTAMGWFWVLCIAVVSTVIASTAFFAGLRRIGPANASILSTMEPVTTVALAALVLGESIGPAPLVGGTLVIASVLLLQFLSPNSAAPPTSTQPTSTQPASTQSASTQSASTQPASTQSAPIRPSG